MKIKEARIKFNLFKLLNKLNFISSVEKIYLIEPFFSLLREKTGQWNLSKIKEKSKIVRAEKFKFPELKLNIKDGKLVIEDHFLSKIKFYFNPINLNADFQNNGEFILETFLNSSPLKIQGYFNAKSKQLNLNLNIPGLTLNFLNLAFMDDTFIIKNGYSDLNLFCKIPLSSIENLDYQGELNLKGGEAVCKNIIGKFNKVSGKIKIANQYLYSSQLKGIFNKIPFKLSGELYDFTIPQLKLTFISDKIKLNVLENFFPKNYKLKLEGIAKGELNLKGGLNNLNYKLILFSDNFKINQKKYQAGFVNLEFSGKNYKIKKLLGKDKNFLFSAEGWLFPSIKHPVIFLKGKLQEKILFKFANSEINNKINFNCFGNLQSPIILGSSDIRVNFLKIKPIRSNFIFNDQNLLIENLKNDNFLSFRGLIDLRKNLLNLNLSASDYNFAFNFNKIKAFGSLWGDGQITGNLNNPSFLLRNKGNLSINNYKLNLKDLNLIGNLKTGAYCFMDGESKTGSFQIKGLLNKNLKSLALIKLNNFKLNNFFSEKIIQGETNLEALTLINKDYLKLFGHLNFKKSLFLGIPVCEAELELKKYKSHPAYLSISLKNKNDFQTNFQGSYEKNNLDFKFRSNFSNNIFLKLKLNNFNFKNLKNFLGWEKFKGDFFLSGKINGSIKNPRISTYFKIPEAYINNELINLDGEFNYFFPKLNLTKFNLKLKNQFLGINGILNFKGNSNLNVFTDKIEIASLSNLTPLKNLNLSGILKGNLQLSGIPKEPKLSGEVNLNKLNFKGQEIESFDLKFIASKKQSILKNLDLTIGSEKIQAEGIYDYLNGFNLKFYTNNLSLENIPFLKRKLEKAIFLFY
ncbi:MAG: hypothetical protein HYU63_00425 [Armatimonadetes bacterium]|nr:hypothetical protein [Armatimonadota bacterium]